MNGCQQVAICNTICVGSFFLCAVIVHVMYICLCVQHIECTTCREKRLSGKPYGAACGMALPKAYKHIEDVAHRREPLQSKRKQILSIILGCKLQHTQHHLVDYTAMRLQKNAVLHSNCHCGKQHVTIYISIMRLVAALRSCSKQSYLILCKTNRTKSELRKTVLFWHSTTRSYRQSSREPRV